MAFKKFTPNLNSPQPTMTSDAMDVDQAGAFKGKGRGKKSTAPSQPQNSSSFFDRFRPSFSGPSTSAANDTQSEASSSHQSQTADPPSYAQATATEKTVYIKQVDLLLNGTPLDQIDSRETGKMPSIDVSLSCHELYSFKVYMLLELF